MSNPVKFIDEEENNEVMEDVVSKSESKTSDNIEDNLTNFYQVELPSKGYLGYPSVIEYRDVVFGDEVKIKMATDETYIRTVNKVLKGILNNPSFYDDICIFDRDYLLLWTFANSYSPKQPMQMTCQSCGSKNDVTIDLTELNVTDIDPEIPVPFKMDLKSGESIEVHLPTVSDELVAESLYRDSKEYNFDDYMIQSTIKVKDKQFKNQKQKFEWIIENINAKEISVIKKFHERFSYGVDDRIERECENCGEVNTGRYPFRLEDFFIYSGPEDDFEYYLRLNKKT